MDERLCHSHPRDAGARLHSLASSVARRQIGKTGSRRDPGGVKNGGVRHLEIVRPSTADVVKAYLIFVYV